MVAKPLEWVRAPQQARSQKTMTKLLDAAEAIIDEKGLEAATVSEIAKRAGSSVGAFYARFPDKEALLRTVLQRFHEQAIATAQAALDPERWQGVTFRDAVEAMTRFMLGILKERRPLIVALLQRAAVDPEVGALGEMLHQAIAEQLLALLDRRRQPISHPDPELGVSVAVWMVLSAVEVHTIYQPGMLPRQSDAELSREMARMVSAYLGADEIGEDDWRRETSVAAQQDGGS